jgi:hypothetical protein
MFWLNPIFAVLDDFELDLLGLISDPYRETSAFGAQIQFIPNGVPRCLNLVVNSIDDVINLEKSGCLSNRKGLWTE